MNDDTFVWHCPYSVTVGTSYDFVGEFKQVDQFLIQSLYRKRQCAIILSCTPVRTPSGAGTVTT